MFSNFESCKQRMNNKMFFFVENSPGTFIRDKTFRTKSSWSCMEEYNGINKLCFNLRDRLDEVFQHAMGMKKSTKYVHPRKNIENFTPQQKHQCDHQ